jgi:hypothetical protein
MTSSAPSRDVRPFETSGMCRSAVVGPMLTRLSRQRRRAPPAHEVGPAQMVHPAALGTVLVQPRVNQARCSSRTTGARSGLGPSTGTPGATVSIGSAATGGGGAPSSRSQSLSWREDEA